MLTYARGVTVYVELSCGENKCTYTISMVESLPYTLSVLKR